MSESARALLWTYSRVIQSRIVLVASHLLFISYLCCAFGTEIDAFLLVQPAFVDAQLWRRASWGLAVRLFLPFTLAGHGSVPRQLVCITYCAIRFEKF